MRDELGWQLYRLRIRKGGQIKRWTCSGIMGNIAFLRVQLSVMAGRGLTVPDAIAEMMPYLLKADHHGRVPPNWMPETSKRERMARISLASVWYAGTVSEEEEYMDLISQANALLEQGPKVSTPQTARVHCSGCCLHGGHCADENVVDEVETPPPAYRPTSSRA